MRRLATTRWNTFVLLMVAILLPATPAAMARMAASGSAPAGHHHEHHSQAPGSGSQCCEFCVAPCSTVSGGVAPLSGPTAIQAIPAEPEFLAPTAVGPTVVPHRLPFAQPPPPLM